MALFDPIQKIDYKKIGFLLAEKINNIRLRKSEKIEIKFHCIQKISAPNYEAAESTGWYCYLGINGQLLDFDQRIEICQVVGDDDEYLHGSIAHEHEKEFVESKGTNPDNFSIRIDSLAMYLTRHKHYLTSNGVELMDEEKLSDSDTERLFTLLTIL